MDKQDIKKIMHDTFIKPLRDNAEKATIQENLTVEKQAEKPKKGNMRRGKKCK